MPVYVDDMYRYPMGRFRRMKMSHMMADSRDELLAMADLIGLDRAWLQNAGQGRDREHFDVSLAYRRKAVAAGAIEVSMTELARIRRTWRQARAGSPSG